MSKKLQISQKERVLNTFRTNPVFRFSVDKAVALHMRAHGRSDPFAGRRIRAHIMQGLELPSEIIESAQAVLNARDDKFAYLA
jgi:hypothetical protein